jgi:hypothetical protein
MGIGLGAASVDKGAINGAAPMRMDITTAIAIVILNNLFGPVIPELPRIIIGCQSRNN